MKYAIGILVKELGLDKIALRKSKESFENGRHDKATYEMHLSNLEPRIEKLEIAINILKNGK